MRFGQHRSEYTFGNLRQTQNQTLPTTYTKLNTSSSIVPYNKNGGSQNPQDQLPPATNTSNYSNSPNLPPADGGSSGGGGGGGTGPSCQCVPWWMIALACLGVVDTVAIVLKD